MLDTLRQKVAELGAEALLITRPANVRYLSGFKSSQDGRILLTEDSAKLITDGRYTAQVAEESRLETDITAASTLWPVRVRELAQPYKLAFEADHLTYDQVEAFRKDLEHELIPTTGLVSDLRLYKSEREIETLRQAAALADEAFTYILNVIKAGISEVEVALELESFMRRNGAEDKAFDITVASGYRSSMPHGTASPKIIGANELVTLDYGARLDGYHSDMTRTIAVGKLSQKERQMYDAVLEAQQLALEAVGPGKDGKAIDELARETLKKHGLEQYFTHGLGHGVGLEVHEAPRLSFRQSDILHPGMVVTIEPGVYIPGEAGVRIEDLAVVTKDGYERLSNSPKEFIQI